MDLHGSCTCSSATRFNRKDARRILPLLGGGEGRGEDGHSLLKQIEKISTEQLLVCAKEMFERSRSCPPPADQAVDDTAAWQPALRYRSSAEAHHINAACPCRSP